MNSHIIPTGWVRAAALQVNTAPSPYITDPRILAVVTPYHTTQPGSQAQLAFDSVEEYNLWFRWWFDAPLPNPNPSFTVKDWGDPKAAPAVWDQSKPHSQRPFDTPKPQPVKNPFAAKPNPFDKPQSIPWPRTS